MKGSKNIMNTSLNVKQFGYKFAVSGDNTKALAREFHSAYPNFPDNVPDEIKADLDNGAILRYAENNASKEGYHVLEGSAYKQVEKAEFDKAKGDKYHLTVANSTGITGQAFGALKTKNPALHALLKELRKGALEYARAKFNALSSEINKIKNEGKPRERGATRTFAETLNEFFDGLPKKAKNALARGDDTVNDAKLKLAIAKFKTEYFGNYKAKVQE
jgi:hypothetical protein